MDKLKKLIKESTQGLKLKKPCSCGCNTCEVTENTLFTLNENLAPREILSDGLKHHITKKKPLTENVYRAGSNSYFNLWAEARALYSRGILEIQNPNDLEILTETNLGEFGILEDGTKVPLDFIMEEEEVFPFEHKGIKYNVEVASNTTNDRGQKLYKISIDGVGSYNEYTSERDAHIDAKREIDDQLIFESKKNKQYYKNIASLDKKGLAKKQFSDEEIQIAKKMLSRGEFKLDESKNENKPIGKPMRGGPKKFYVYVRDPKTKKVKKVTFGDSGGLKTKINDPKARKAFAARHKCGQGEEKTSPKWWSCRIGRYWKQLGGDKNFSGFW